MGQHPAARSILFVGDSQAAAAKPERQRVTILGYRIIRNRTTAFGRGGAGGLVYRVQ